MCNRWIEYAKRKAFADGKGKYRLAAIILDKRGRLISSAVNSYAQTHPRQDYYARRVGCERKQYLHAEIAALVKCHIPPYRIVIARIDRQGEGRLAQPCSICSLAIRESGIKIVEYTT